jgi:hypothetical protein
VFVLAVLAASSLCSLVRGSPFCLRSRWWISVRQKVYHEALRNPGLPDVQNWLTATLAIVRARRDWMPVQATQPIGVFICR